MALYNKKVIQMLSRAKGMLIINTYSAPMNEGALDSVTLAPII